MDTEAAFQAALDADPTDAGIRMIFADFLDEIGDPRGPGYRALGRLDRVPNCLDSSWYWWNNSKRAHQCALPQKWFSVLKIRGSDDNCAPRFRLRDAELDPASRREVEDAAALAWSCLSPAEQAEILSQAEVPA